MSVGFRAEWHDAEGLPRTQDLQAADRAAALSTLGPEPRHGLRKLVSLEIGRPGLDQLARAAAGLARLLERGVPLGPALKALARAEQDGRLAGELATAAQRAEEGASLPDALAAGDGVLSAPLIQTLLAPQGGSAELLREVATLANRLEAGRQAAQARLAYPFSLGALGLLMSAFAVQLVGSTARGLSAIDEGGPFLRLLWQGSERVGMVWALAIAGVALIGLVWRWLSHRLGALTLSKRTLPGLGGDLKGAVALRALATLLRHGLPADAAWQRVCEAIGVPGVNDLEEGSPLPEALGARGLIHPAEVVALQAAQAADPKQGLADELSAIGEARLSAHEQRLERGSAILGLGLELCMAAAVLALGVSFLSGRAL